MQNVSGDTYERDVVQASHDLPVLVDFWGARCGPCIKMEPWVEGFAAEHASELTVVKLNSDENRTLCRGMRVMGLPTFMLYRDGLEVRRLSSDDCTPANIVRTLTEVLPGFTAEPAAPA